jgi:hypothetical protein
VVRVNLPNRGVYLCEFSPMAPPSVLALVRLSDEYQKPLMAARAGLGNTPRYVEYASRVYYAP